MMTRTQNRLRVTHHGMRLAAYGAWVTALFFGSGARADAAASTVIQESSVHSLLHADEASIASLLRRADGKDKLIPRTLPKTPKWQGRLTDLQDVPNASGIQVRVAVPAHSRVTLGSGSVDFEQPANVLATAKDSKPPPLPGVCQGSCKGLSLKALEADVLAAIPKAKDDPSLAKGPTLTIHLAPDHVELTPKRINLAKVGERWQVKMAGTAFDHGMGVNIFVRDSKVIHWRSETRVIEAAAVGRTELYVVAGGQMQIVPVEVAQDGQQQAPALNVASSLLSLNNVLSPSSRTQASRTQVASLDADLPSYRQQVLANGWQAAETMNGDEATGYGDDLADVDAGAGVNDDDAVAAPVEVSSASSSTTAAASGTDDLGVANDIQVYAYQGERKFQANLGKTQPLSLRDSAIDAIKTQELAKRGQDSFVRVKRKPEYKTISFQVVDERSIPERGIIYPVVGAKVRILGTEFVAVTNATGHVSVSDIPADARILVAVEDTNKGLIRPTTTEVVVKSLAPNEVTRIKVLSYKSFEAYAAVFGTVPIADQGSYCGRLLPSAAYPSVANLNVRIRGGAEGPFYFSPYGPGPNQIVTGDDGRFCFFNVNPGLFEVGIYDGEDYLTSLVLPIFGGRHSEDDISLANGPEVKMHVAAQAPAQGQIFGDRLTANQLQPVDALDMLVVGENEKMSYVDSGLMSLPSGATFHQGRKYVMANAGEFEPTLYSIDTEDADHGTVAPLLPRGFVEEVYNELSMGGSGNGEVYDPSLGALVVNHGALEGQANKAINIKLVDQNGREIEGGWYFGSEGDEVTKAIFFNLEPGMYTVIVETDNNYWLAVDTVAVDNWTTSYVATGSRLVPQQAPTINQY